MTWVTSYYIDSHTGKKVGIFHRYVVPPSVERPKFGSLHHKMDDFMVMYEGDRKVFCPVCLREGRTPDAPVA